MTMKIRNLRHPSKAAKHWKLEAIAAETLLSAYGIEDVEAWYHEPLPSVKRSATPRQNCNSIEDES